MNDDIQPLHVFDLPQLYTKPSAEKLLAALRDLAVLPRTFDSDENQAPKLSPVYGGCVAQYLTGIISSALSWIDTDELREAIWDAASARLCERSGRTAMPSLSRVFRIPVADNIYIPITLHEPSLTSDNLGMKTWVSSYLLARRLHTFRLPQPSLLPLGHDKQLLRVLELGAGTGLVGLSFASLWGANSTVHLTDLPEIVPNLSHNVSMNKDIMLSTGASVTTGVLDWSLKKGMDIGNQEKYQVILAADPLYSSEHLRWLTQTIQRWLSTDKGARVVLEMPLRNAYISQVNELKKRMGNIGLKVLEAGEEIGHDDWEMKDGSPLEVNCWWSVWMWDDEKLCGG
ncbi:hypothetical protein LOY86_005403 [Ophidiomyces ophidiicola]|nr:hypothetical protein LOY86_005403 [Ophidiomyces ophidiicola]